MRQKLVAAVSEDLPLPGQGSTAKRFEALFEFARGDLELARLAEAHHDARAIAAELGATLPDGALYGVWAATGPDPLVAEHRANGYRLRGVAPWCTGVGILDRALVTARLGSTSVLVRRVRGRGPAIDRRGDVGVAGIRSDEHHLAAVRRQPRL